MSLEENFSCQGLNIYLKMRRTNYPSDFVMEESLDDKSQFWLLVIGVINSGLNKKTIENKV